MRTATNTDSALDRRSVIWRAEVGGRPIDDDDVLDAAATGQERRQIENASENHRAEQRHDPKPLLPHALRRTPAGPPPDLMHGPPPARPRRRRRRLRTHQVDEDLVERRLGELEARQSGAGAHQALQDLLRIGARRPARARRTAPSRRPSPRGAGPRISDRRHRWRRRSSRARADRRAIRLTSARVPSTSFLPRAMMHT